MKKPKRSIIYPVDEIVREINVSGLKKILNDDGLGGQINEETTIGDSIPTSFAEILLERLKSKGPDYEKIIKTVSMFRDQVVVDLGAGLAPHGRTIAEIGGAKGYIAVEPHFYLKLRENMIMYSPVKSSLVAEDMFSFLRRLPSNSVSIWASGIDSCILTDENYILSTASEIARVLHPKGVYAYLWCNIQLKDEKGNLLPNISIGAKDSINCGSYVKTK